MIVDQRVKGPKADTTPAEVRVAALALAGLEVEASRDAVPVLADLRADQAATGCEEASASCMAELANALGADWRYATLVDA